LVEATEIVAEISKERVKPSLGRSTPDEVPSFERQIRSHLKSPS